MEESKRPKNCGECDFWKGVRGVGRCRFSPPRVVVLSGAPVTRFPETMEKDWCGKGEKA